MSDDFWARVHAFVSQIDRRSYYEILRVTPEADADAIRRSFYQWAPQLHPDRFARETDERRKWELSLLYARMREAFDVLVDPVRRAGYDEGLREGIIRPGPERRARSSSQGPHHPRARRFYDLGLERMRAGATGEAQFQFQMALQLEPECKAIHDALAKLGPGEGAAPSPSSGVPRPVVDSPSTRMRAALDAAVRPPGEQAPAVPLRRPRPAAPAVQPRPAPPRPAAARPVRRGVRGEPAAIVGIDFGTTRSSIAVALGDTVCTLPDERGRTLHPSIVHYPETGAPLCGWEAREMVFRAPQRTVSSPKRLLGKQYDDSSVAGMLHGVAYKTSRGPNGAIVIDMKGMQAALPQVCAQVVAHVRGVGEARIGRRIERAVLSVPVSFGEAERNAVTTVARIAGLEVAALIDEPVAAAMAYGFGRDKKEVIAVYDFGGGTFDFTVIDIEGYHFNVLARGGDSWLGGDDFDAALANAVANALWRATGVEVQNRQVEWQRLLFACEKAKRELSLRAETQIIVNAIVETPKPVNLRQKIGRPVLERLCRPLFERSIDICKSALNRVGLDPSDVQQVVASGGVSYMPFVREGLGTFFGRSIRSTVSPDEAICLGAGIRAAQLSQRPVTGIGRV